jgi:hypothetical protein
MARQAVRDLAHLIALASRDEGLECYVELAGGIGRSSKTIRYMAPVGRFKVGRFEVFNDLDETWQSLWPKQLWSLSNIGLALDRGALVIDR